MPRILTRSAMLKHLAVSHRHATRRSEWCPGRWSRLCSHYHQQYISNMASSNIYSLLLSVSNDALTSTSLELIQRGLTWYE